jgi:hypothetical protein
MKGTNGEERINLFFWTVSVVEVLVLSSLGGFDSPVDVR